MKMQTARAVLKEESDSLGWSTDSLMYRVKALYKEIGEKGSTEKQLGLVKPYSTIYVTDRVRFLSAIKTLIGLGPSYGLDPVPNGITTEEFKKISGVFSLNRAIKLLELPISYSTFKYNISKAKDPQDEMGAWKNEQDVLVVQMPDFYHKFKQKLG